MCTIGSCGQMYGHGLQVWISQSQRKADEEDISSLPSRLMCACVHPCVAICGHVCVCVSWMCMSVHFEVNRAGVEILSYYGGMADGGMCHLHPL